MNISPKNIDFYASMDDTQAQLEALKKEGKELLRTRKTASPGERAALDARMDALEAEIAQIASQICFLKKS